MCEGGKESLYEDECVNKNNGSDTDDITGTNVDAPEPPLMTWNE